MSADESRPQIRRVRPVEKKILPSGPARDLRDAIYLLYAEADRPQLQVLARQITDDNNNDLPGSPKKDLIGKIISGDGLASQPDTVTVAVALARAAGRQEIAPVADQIRRLWSTAVAAQPASPTNRLGRPIGDCDPLVLGVHPAIQEPGTGAAVVLPEYVPRVHDGRLRETVDQMFEDGCSRLVTLVGGPSTGKTRACWELVRYLDRQRPGRWRLWHPYDPSYPDAVLADLGRVGPDTMVWLDQAESFLAPPDVGLGERIAAGLRTLLGDAERGLVLVLATLWSEGWNALTIRPSWGSDAAKPPPDPYRQARELLTGSRVSVASVFTQAEIAGLQHTSGDSRVRQAAAHAEGGRVTQYLAATPALQDRYDTASPAAKAIIQIAIDARRLGHPPALPHALLEQAAPGYLDDHDWDSVGNGDSLHEDWLEQALAEAARPAKGARGPLTRIRARPGDPATKSEQPCYRLADYLEQTGRHERGAVYPPESLWTTLAETVTNPVLLRHFGEQAQKRGRYQHAIWLYTQAAARGDAGALTNLATLREVAGDPAGAETLAIQAADRGDTDGLLDLAGMRMDTDPEGAEALYRQAADRGNTIALNFLAGMWKKAGDTVGAEALYRQGVDRGDAAALRDLARLREEAGDAAAAEVLYRQAADWGDATALTFLVEMWESAGNAASAETLAVQVADRGDTYVLWSLAMKREVADDATGAEALYRQAAARGDNTALTSLASMRAEADDATGAEALYRQAAARGDTNALTGLAKMRAEVGDAGAAEALYRQAADRGDVIALEELALMRERTGDAAGAETLALQGADRGAPYALVLLAFLRERTGDLDGATRMRRFGLTGSGEIASGLDFGS